MIPDPIPLSLSQSGKRGNFLPPSEFLVKDAEQEKKFSFRLEQSLSTADAQPLLQVPSHSPLGHNARQLHVSSIQTFTLWRGKGTTLWPQKSKRREVPMVKKGLIFQYELTSALLAIEIEATILFFYVCCPWRNSLAVFVFDGGAWPSVTLSCCQAGVRGLCACQVQPGGLRYICLLLASLPGL